ncbi:MAG: hypothetical protein JXD22_07275 [Sedimentisphaerales bacterium]|nr:hypothetical protein [Sedimentisphaerales bacterium]
MDNNVFEQLEAQLDSFDVYERRAALERLCELAGKGEIELPVAGDFVNIHCHTFFSYNSYGYSPSKFAWLGRKQGLAVAGIVDFDVLDGLEEFYAAGDLLNLKCCVGLESRVFVPEFADKEMTSPGEPGITYQMGVGFCRADPAGQTGEFLADLKRTAQQRNRELTGRVNRFLSPVELDYEADVLSLTPAGNPTERHLCVAYSRKAREIFTNEAERKKFWVEKLGLEALGTQMAEDSGFLNLLRAKTMKRGGAGYVQPDRGSFPKLAQMNQFVRNAGGIPTHTWLNGFSDGEQDMERLLEVSMSSGAAAINIIPDRNYGGGDGEDKLKNLYEVVELSQKLDLIIVSGTEMNSPGQKFVDDFDSDELKPLLAACKQGAEILYGHCLLQRAGEMGYYSAWAEANFSGAAAKNEFYEKVGSVIEPRNKGVLKSVTSEDQPETIIGKVTG